MDQQRAAEIKEQVAAETSMPWELLPVNFQKKIGDYYRKKMKKHPNMSRERLLKLCGKKFNMKFEIEDPFHSLLESLKRGERPLNVGMQFNQQQISSIQAILDMEKDEVYFKNVIESMEKI